MEGDTDAFFQDKKAMTISEVAISLEQYTSERRMRDPNYQPNLLVARTMEYTNTVSTNKNPDTVRKIRRYVVRRYDVMLLHGSHDMVASLCSVLAEAGMTEQELAMIANLQLQAADEAKKLIPSLAVRAILHMCVCVCVSSSSSGFAILCAYASLLQKRNGIPSTGISTYDAIIHKYE